MSRVDYAHTPQALADRAVKAQALADAAASLGVTVDRLAPGGGMRRTVWKAAGLLRAPGEETWTAACELVAVAPPRVRRTQPCNTPGCTTEDTHLYPSGWWCDPHSPWARRGLTRSDPNRVPGQPCELDRLRAARAAALAAPREPERALGPSPQRPGGSTTAVLQAVRSAQAHRARRGRSP